LYKIIFNIFASRSNHTNEAFTALQNAMMTHSANFTLTATQTSTDSV